MNITQYITDNIQVGLDLATSASIIFAALAYLWSAATERKREAQQFKTKELTNAIEKLSLKLEDVKYFQERLIWQNSGVGKVEPKEIFDQLRAVEIKCEVLLATAFATWATDAEKKSLGDIIKSSKHFLESIAKDPKADVSISDIIDKISDAINKLSTNLIQR